MRGYTPTVPYEDHIKKLCVVMFGERFLFWTWRLVMEAVGGERFVKMAGVGSL